MEKENKIKKEKKKKHTGLIITCAVIGALIVLRFAIWPMIQTIVASSGCKERFGDDFKAQKCHHGGWKCVSSNDETEYSMGCYDGYSPYTQADKPIIYIYPEKDMDLEIKLGNVKDLTHTYPEYNDSWSVHVTTNGNIYDYKTKRNYYALYWEGKDNSKIDISEGFVVKSENIVNFLEEKLEYLGLNEREIEEFIIYWLPKLKENKYNYIRFRTTEEVNKYMPLYFSKNPDTLIRIIMDFKGLDKIINVREQNLNKVIRNGYTVVEWGGRDLDL